MPRYANRGSISPRVPWEEYDFHPDAFRRRSFHVCEAVPRRKIVRMLLKLQRMHRLKSYVSLLKEEPLRGLGEVGAMIRRKSLMAIRRMRGSNTAAR